MSIYVPSSDWPQLAPLLTALVARCAQEETDLRRLLSFALAHSDVLTRENALGHFTASAWIVSPDRKQVLLAYHNLYQAWGWLGGHADGQADLEAVARREVQEESGLSRFTLLDPQPISFEVLPVSGHLKHGQWVSAHDHYNLTYLYEADPRDPVRIAPLENAAIGWVSVNDVLDRCQEPCMQPIYAKLMARVPSP